MTVTMKTPWHKASYDRFIQESLPRLLSERIPLMGYAVKNTGKSTCQVCIEVGSNGHGVKVTYDLPKPDANGLFSIGEDEKIVVPFASEPDLRTAKIDCVGEQLYKYMDAQLGKISADLPWDEQLAHAWLPLDTWADTFFKGTGDGYLVETAGIVVVDSFATNTVDALVRAHPEIALVVFEDPGGRVRVEPVLF